MRNYNVLVTAISGDVGNSILKCLARDPYLQNLYGCDIFRYPCGINKVKGFFQVVPCANTKVYLRQILEIIDQCEINLIVPANEQEIQVFDRYREVFLSHGIQVLLHRREIYDWFSDKYKTAELLKNLGLPFIETSYTETVDRDIQFPAVIKDVFSCGSKDIHIVNNWNEFARYSRNTRDQIVQKYVGSPEEEYTVPVFSNGKKDDIVCFPFRRTLSKAGYTNFLEPVDEDNRKRIEEICRKISAFIRLEGAVDFQMRRENGEFYIFECNPRLSGTVNFRAQLGFEDAVWWTHLAMGEMEEVQFAMPEKRFVGIRELDEIIFYPK